MLPLRPLRAAAVFSALAVAGCDDPTLSKDQARMFQLIEKGQYQTLQTTNGIERILHDRNGDGVADAIILYGPQGRLRMAEIDTNLDTIVDRWEHFEHGEMIGVTYDIDGDGKPDRAGGVAPP